jgi:copper chaperone
MAMITIAIENLKCGGCAKSISKGLGELAGVTNVSVSHEDQTVSLEADPAQRPAIVEKLASLGYPEVGSVEGLAAGLANAKSFVSCAIGRMS